MASPEEKEILEPVDFKTFVRRASFRRDEDKNAADSQEEEEDEIVPTDFSKFVKRVSMLDVNNSKSSTDNNENNSDSDDDDATEVQVVDGDDVSLIEIPEDTEVKQALLDLKKSTGNLLKEDDDSSSSSEDESEKNDSSDSEDDEEFASETISFGNSENLRRFEAFIKHASASKINTTSRDDESPLQRIHSTAEMIQRRSMSSPRPQSMPARRASYFDVLANVNM